MEESRTPKVYGNEDLTIAVNESGLSLHIGQTRLENIRSISISEEPKKKVQVIVTMRTCRDPEDSLRIEENARVLEAKAKWVKILR
jgi:hypothetical protein